MVTKVIVIRRRGALAAALALRSKRNEGGVAKEGNAVLFRPQNKLEKKSPTQDCSEKKRKIVDLRGVPDQPPIRKSDGMKGTSKFVGVHYKAARKRWTAQISIDGSKYHIGNYKHEEDAAKDFARALFKYNPSKHYHQEIDLSDVPEQAPILSKNMFRLSCYSLGLSKWQGVSFSKATNKWLAQIVLDKKQRIIGYYDIEEDAARAYARAAYKYKPEGIYQHRLESEEEELLPNKTKGTVG